MPFPESDRVIFKKNPLEKVICQLRFPPILKIDKEIPSEFQEKIREKFPKYELLEEPNIPLPPELKSSDPSNIVNMAFSSLGNKNHKFSTEDDSWDINLKRTFLALTARNYESWEDFWEKLQDPLNALLNIYKPSYYSRIGLRYIDVINREALGLKETSWNDLLIPQVLGLLSSPVGEKIQSSESTYFVQLGNGDSIARIRTVFEKTTEENDHMFKIDTDFFLSQKTEVDNAKEILERFALLGGRLIRWIIKKKLHTAMKPQEP